MYLRLCFILFIAFHTYAAINIDQGTLMNVFGGRELGAAPSLAGTESAAAARREIQQSQAVAVTESTETTERAKEPVFIQSTFEYDAFDLMLTKYVLDISNTNLLLSPLGLKLALSILTEGATGPTQEELASVLGFSRDTYTVRKKFSTILESLSTNSSDYILNLGSRVYLEEQAHPQQQFAAIAEHFYRTQLVALNFTDPPLAAQEINTWVSNVTDGKITSLVKPDDLEGIVAMVVTTLFFKGIWVNQFPTLNTNMGTFYAQGSEPKSVSFMNLRAKLYCADIKEYDAKLLRLPYMGNKFSMYMLVPNSLEGHLRLTNLLTPRILKEHIMSLSKRIVDVSMPKFQFDFTSVLDGILQQMGIRQAFMDTASFPGIARGQGLRNRLKVSKVLQRSGIEVNERGSIAYSATEILLENKFGEDTAIVEVIANKPFLFFIQDEATRQLLFTGRVSNPEQVS